MTFLYRFSRNSYLLKGITWKFFVPNFIQFCWEIQKLRYKFVQVHKVKYDSHCSDFDENRTSSTAVHKVQFNSGYCRLRRYISNSCLIGWLFAWRGYITQRKLSGQKHSSLTLQATEISKSYTGRCIWDCYFSQTSLAIKQVLVSYPAPLHPFPSFSPTSSLRKFQDTGTVLYSCAISGFRSGVYDVIAVLSFYAVYIGSCLHTFRSAYRAHLQRPVGPNVWDVQTVPKRR